MCWRGNIRDRRIAIKDIHCKKILAYAPLEPNGRAYSGYFRTNHKYELYNTYYAVINPIVPGDTGSCFIEKGLHCYSKDVEIKQVEYGLLVKINKQGQPIIKTHIIKSSDMNGSFFGKKGLNIVPVVVDCIIPEGTRYYKNKQGEIVTETLYIGDVIMMYQYEKKD